MPVYKYECPGCHCHFEVSKSVDDRYMIRCPKCRTVVPDAMPEYKGGESMDIKKLLPQSPMAGPPLPQILDVKWPEAVRRKLGELKSKTAK